ncbi:TspO/MBR family protein [uncultured Negativibacillus sp.]|uniref:TspO/MBR family protein n=1 Tax=uncultured Negativibacillus sp. TaxID=1980696 RepID=UPI0025F00220|nr:TspO/MBR family protein [uncultured Negativibacillus sp.]
MSKKQSLLALALNLVLVAAVSGLSVLLSGDGMGRYPDLVRPPFSPPGIVFPVVWTILFILMAVSAWMILRSLTEVFSIKGALYSSSLLLYFVQLIVNLLWPVLFFRLSLYLPALLWLVLLIVLVVQMIRSFYRVNKTAALLQIPYLLWLVFAGYLNLGVWLLN